MLEVGERPWGKYFVLQDEPNFKLKRIEVLPNQRLSYQYHHHRQEFWTIVEGEAVVVLDGEENFLQYGQSIFIPQGAKHRIENRSDKVLVFVEVQKLEALEINAAQAMKFIVSGGVINIHDLTQEENV